LASGAVTDPKEIDRLRTALRLYCQRDTLAMVEMHRALRRSMSGNTKAPIVPFKQNNGTIPRLQDLQ
jgi:hypothetical protein